jgi:hypothetical protein
VPHCDVVTINASLHPETEGLFDDELIGTMKRGAYRDGSSCELLSLGHTQFGETGRSPSRNVPDCPADA